MSGSEIAEPLKEFVGAQAEAMGVTSGRVIQAVENNYGLDLAEVSEEDAQTFIDALEADDTETIQKVMANYDVDEDAIDRFVEQVRLAQEVENDDSGEDDPETETRSNGHKEVSSADTSGEPSTDDIERMINDAVERKTPDANEIVDRLEARLTEGQGEKAPAGGDGPPDWQKQLAAQIASQSLGGGGNSAAQQMGEKFQSAAMNSFLKKLSRPTIGDMVEMKMADQMSDDIADEYAEEFFKNPLEELNDTEDDDSDDDSGGWSPW